MSAFAPRIASTAIRGAFLGRNLMSDTYETKNRNPH